MTSDTRKVMERIRELFGEINFYDACPDCKGQCCKLPWITDDECSLVRLFPTEVKTLDGTRFFLDEKRCKFLGEDERCAIYPQRPLDCRLYPLDIIEEEGRYYWCLFTDCPGWRNMRTLLDPLIPKIESEITAPLWQEYKRQIAITKEIYEPYRNGRYVIVRPFKKFD